MNFDLKFDLKRYSLTISDIIDIYQQISMIMIFLIIIYYSISDYDQYFAIIHFKNNFNFT